MADEGGAAQKGEGPLDKMTEKPLILHEGYPFIGAAAAVTVLFAWLGWFHAAAVPFVLMLYFAYFSAARNGPSPRETICSYPRRTGRSWQWKTA